MIVLDLSLPNELWNTMETLLSQVKKGFDICREVELTSVRERLKLHNYLFSDMQPIIPMPYTSAGLISVPLTNLTHLCDQCVLRKVIFVIKLSASAKSNTKV